MEDLITISIRIPKKMNEELESEAKRRHYATKSEVVREALRSRLYYEAIAPLRGALKGKVDLEGKTTAQWRRDQWQEFLKKSGGDRKKALQMHIAEMEKAVEGLKF